MTTMHMLETAEADIASDVRGPLPAADGRPPLFMIGQPMDASGFGALASHFRDRTVVTYDPRGLGRSIRKDGRVDNAPTVQADDVHRRPCSRATTVASSAASSDTPAKPEAFARKLREVLEDHN